METKKMNHHTSDPLIVVTNASSTKAKSIEAEVLRPLEKCGIEFTRFKTRFRLADDNVKDFLDHLPEKSRVISAAGDGTAEQLATAALQKEGLTIGVLPYGNYNDTALSHMDKNQTVLDFVHDDVSHIVRKPMAIEINGEYVSESFSYATFGLTALIAAGFRDEVSRERMRMASPMRRTILRYGQAGLDYLKYAGNKLPDFRVDDTMTQSGRTDLAFTNNPTVARLLRFEDTYFDKDYFGARTDLDMKSLHDLATFGVPSLFGKAPLDSVEEMRVQFEHTAHKLPFQSGGEYQEIDADSVYVYKDPAKKVTYLHPKRAS